LNHITMLNGAAKGAMHHPITCYGACINDFDGFTRFFQLAFFMQ